MTDMPDPNEHDARTAMIRDEDEREEWDREMSPELEEAVVRYMDKTTVAEFIAVLSPPAQAHIERVAAGSEEKLGASVLTLVHGLNFAHMAAGPGPLSNLCVEVESAIMRAARASLEDEDREDANDPADADATRAQRCGGRLAGYHPDLLERECGRHGKV